MLGLLLSYCSRFCNLIALLWAPKTNSMETLESLSVWDKITSPEIMWGFIIALFFISSVRVYQGKIFFSLLHMQHLISRCSELGLSKTKKWQHFQKKCFLTKPFFFFTVTQGTRLSTSITHLLVGHIGFYYILTNFDMMFFESQMQQ